MTVSGHKRSSAKTASTLARHPVQRAPNAAAADLQDMRVDQCGGDICETEKILHSTNVAPNRRRCSANVWFTVCGEVGLMVPAASTVLFRARWNFGGTCDVTAQHR